MTKKKIDRLIEADLTHVPDEYKQLIEEYIGSYHKKKNKEQFLKTTAESLDDLLAIYEAIASEEKSAETSKSMPVKKEKHPVKKATSKAKLITMKDGHQFEKVSKEQALQILGSDGSVFAINLDDDTERQIKTPSELDDYEVFGIEFDQTKKEEKSKPKTVGIKPKPKLSASEIQDKTKELQKKLDNCLGKKQTVIKTKKEKRKTIKKKVTPTKIGSDFKSKLTDMLVKITKLIIKEDETEDAETLKKRIKGAYDTFLKPAGVKPSKRASERLDKELDKVLERKEQLENEKLISGWKSTFLSSKKLEDVVLETYQKKTLKDDVKALRKTFDETLELIIKDRQKGLKKMADLSNKNDWNLNSLAPSKVVSEMKQMKLIK